MKKTHSMAKSQQIVNHLPKTAAKCLVIAVASLMSISASQADTANKQIGDLEIYKAAEGGKVTVTMMLDTSGSMAISQVGASACDLPSGTSYARTIDLDSYKTLNPSSTLDYARYGCEYSVANGYEITPDRITRLKDGIFELMNSTKLNSSTVSIGIGQFSTQSDSNNTYKNATGVGGKILVPAALLSDAQRTLIKTEVAKLRGTGGTPAAHAYAEAASYMLGTNTIAPYNGYSTTDYNYSGFNDSIANSKTNGNYISPLATTVSQCDGAGIYFLTDGAPNSSNQPAIMMKTALRSSSDFFVPTTGNNLPNGLQSGHAMPYVGEFSKWLRDTSKNPKAASIRTAVVGFGAEFDTTQYPLIRRTLKKVKVNKSTGLPLTKADGTPDYDGDKEAIYYDCTQITATDAKNACNWGAKSHPLLPNVGGFGEGGFTSAKLPEDVVDSVVKFVDDLNNTIPASPSGTIVVPEDPYNAASQLPVAYYPSLQSNVAGNSAIWQGNMKKYSLFNGSLFGLNDTNASTKLFLNDLGTTGVSTTNGTGSSGKTDPTVRDLWASADVPAKNDLVDSGGSLEHVKVPTTAKIDNVRTVYVEDGTVLKKFGVDLTGKVTLGGAVYSDTNTFVDTIYTKEKIQALIQFLGFTLSDADKALAIKDLTLTTPSNAKPYGATIHSVPAAVSYSAKLDPTTGRVTNERDDYVLFGSMDGALHMVNADSYLQTATALDNAKNISQNGGSEVFAFIPKTIIANQSNALIKGATGNGIGQPYFGMDAPWLVTTNYRYDLANNQVNVDTSNSHGVFAYGGLRMGGAAIYGMNLTDKVNPSLMFAITPATTGFGRMGQIWAKPTKAKIKTSTTDTGTDVLIFGGGYDTCYENPYFQVGVTINTTNKISTECAAKTQAQGNAVYMVNARTGTLIWSASNTTNGNGSSINTNMKNSIVGGINALDRNSDGFMDHLYFADLGGQVFRADFTNAGSTRYTTTTTATGTTQTATAQTAFANQRVTRILSDTPNTTLTGSMKLRFYERPVVSFYRNPTTQRLFTLINVISGDRSSPLTKIRATGTEDRVYGIIDTDVNKAVTQLFDDGFSSTSTTNTQNIINLTDSNLTALPLDLAANRTTMINTAKAAMNNGTSRGWYYPLNRFEGFLNVYNGKGVGKSEVIGNYLYTTVYSPDMNYDTSASCSAKIIGGSERQLYCLPYGICSNATSLSGTGGFVRAGKGIQELTLGPRSDSLANQKVLVGTETLDQRASPRVGYGNDDGKVLASNGGVGLTSSTAVKTSGNYKGDGSAAEFIFNERYVLTPSTWYEVAK